MDLIFQTLTSRLTTHTRVGRPSLSLPLILHHSGICLSSLQDSGFPSDQTQQHVSHASLRRRSKRRKLNAWDSERGWHYASERLAHQWTMSGRCELAARWRVSFCRWLTTGAAGQEEACLLPGNYLFGCSKKNTFVESCTDSNVDSCGCFYYWNFSGTHLLGHICVQPGENCWPLFFFTAEL